MGLKLYRINALVIRHLYLYKRSIPRLMDIFFWPVMELLLWGFISIYLAKSNFAGANIITVLLGAVIFWDLLSQSQRAVSIAFLEDVWERNFLNIFVTPISLLEFVASTVVLGLVRVFLVVIVMSALAFAFYAFNIFTFGFYLIPFVANLLLFGWALGLFTTAIILRYGSSAQVLAFGFIFLIQPFSAVFYPASVLPESVRWISFILPSTHVFEGMRTVIATGSSALPELVWAFLLNIIYLAVILLFFYKMFAQVKAKGRLLKLD